MTEAHSSELNPEGFGACTKCSCKGYSPTKVYGTCENTRSNGNICGHKGNEHASD